MADDRKNENADQNPKGDDPAFEFDPLTDNKLTVSQQQTPDDEVYPLQTIQDRENKREYRTGDFDPTTGAAHPVADSGADKGVDG